ncbi:MAG: hypothetical protein JSS66_18435 [Armatimonadetes bacterium]|nr:hypothetical protein [Armatimonadota bacterium]
MGARLLCAASLLLFCCCSRADFLYLQDSRMNDLYTFDLVANQATRVGPMGRGGRGGDLAWSGKTLFWSGGKLNQAVYSVNTSTARATQVGFFGGDLSMDGFAVDGSTGKAYVAESGGAIYQIDLSDGAIAFIVTGPAQPGAMCFVPGLGLIVSTVAGLCYKFDPSGFVTFLKQLPRVTAMAYDPQRKVLWIGDDFGNLRQVDYLHNWTVTTFGTGLGFVSGLAYMSPLPSVSGG